MAANNHLKQDHEVGNGSTNSTTERFAMGSMLNGTDTTVVATVELYTVVLVFLLFLTAGVLGTLTNLALLLSIKCKRSIRNLHYALTFGLSATNLLACLLWMLVHCMQMVQNYSGGTAWPALCYLNITAFHLCLGTIVFTTVFLATQRMYRLWQSKSTQVPCLVVTGLCVSWTIGIIATLAMVLEYDHTVDYQICVHGSLTEQSTHTVSHSKVATAISFIYILVLLVVLVGMAILTVHQRRRLAVLVLKGASDSRLSAQENNRQGKRVSLMAGDAGVATTSSREPSGAEANESQAFIPVQESFRPGRVPMKALKQDHADEEDDDTFDMKMRDRWQKTGSGRRHTVANIGIRDTLFGPRRGSLGEAKAPPSNYHYVRKWSVDIVALQDQLENPKLTSSSSPFPGLGILQEKEKETANAAEILEEEADDVTEEKAAAEITPTTETTESKHDDEIEDMNDSTEPLQSSTEPPILCIYGNQYDNKNACHDEGSGEDKVRRLEKELGRCIKFMLLLTLTLLCILPYAVLQILQSSMLPHTNRNMSYIMAALCWVQCPLHPVILAWLDTRLCSALSRLRIKLTHWRCVCYCNIGSGKRCLGRHRKHNIAEEVPDS